MSDDLPALAVAPADTYLGRLVARARGLYDSDVDGEPDPGTLGGLAVSSAREEQRRAARRAKLARRARRAGFHGPEWAEDVDLAVLS